MALSFPGEQLKTKKMPGHWVLARLGKRVLRPGGMELTRRLLTRLQIMPTDEVVEFAPGMGITARLTLQAQPASYTAVERDEAAARIVTGYLRSQNQQCLVALASDTELPSASATVVYGEAMLTMQPPETKREIIREAARLLKRGGRYGIHEMCLLADVEQRNDTKRNLTGVVHHGVSPLTIDEWQSLLESEGLKVQTVDHAPMRLLEPSRIICDEGLFGTLRFGFNLMRDREARERVLEMRAEFRRNRKKIGAVAITAVKE